jgi:hypothetical protein
VDDDEEQRIFSPHSSGDWTFANALRLGLGLMLLASTSTVEAVQSSVQRSLGHLDLLVSFNFLICFTEVWISLRRSQFLVGKVFVFHCLALFLDFLLGFFSPFFVDFCSNFAGLDDAASPSLNAASTNASKEKASVPFKNSSIFFEPGFTCQ